MAAVLAGGTGAALSHGSAAALWGIRPSHGTLHVTVPQWKPSRLDLRFHTSPLPADEITERSGIPVTTPPRTLLDLAAVLDRHTLERAFHQCEIQQLWDSRSVPDLIERHGARRGIRNLRWLLGRLDAGTAVTRSELEDRFLAFVAAARLPRPQTNQPIEIAGELFEGDCLWREQRVIAELDGRAFHSTRHAFERDRRRHRVLEARGWRTIQVTWLQLEQEADELAADLRRLLLPE